MAIEFKHDDISSLIRFAAQAAKDGQYVLCVHNLNDAMRRATTNEERSSVYRCFSDMFASIGNSLIAGNALFRACAELDKGGYYALSYEKFLPSDNTVDDGFDPDELPPTPNAETILGYNDVYNFFLTGQYEKGLDILCELPPDLRCLDEVISVLSDAVSSGEKIDLSKHEYKILVLAGLYAPRNGEFVKIMLQGSQMTRELMVGGADFFTTECPDIRILSDIGRAFFEENEFSCAEKCYEKILEECEIDECALFYLSQIAFLTDNKEKAEKYWSRYKLVYARFGAPIEAFEEEFKRKNTVSYYEWVTSSATAELEIEYDKGGADLSSIESLMAFGPDEFFRKIVKNEGEKIVEIAKKILLSPFVRDLRKILILEAFLKNGYEGRVAVALEKRGIIIDLVKINVRTRRAVWQDVFETVSLGIIKSRSFIPYRPSVIAKDISTFAKKCAELSIKPYPDDVPFLAMIIAAHYNELATKGTNIGWITDIIPQVTGESLKQGLYKFPPEVLDW